MNKKDLLISEIEGIPESCIGEVLDFVQFLKSKTAGETREVTLASESVLKKDWLKPEEDEAWQNL